MARGRKASFTLVELLVVIGIIALLAALLLPVLAAATGSARAARCRSMLQQYYKGIRMYLNNNEEFLPAAWLTDSSGSAADLSNLIFHRFLLHEYCETNFKHIYDAVKDNETIVQKFKRDQAFWEDPGAGWTKDYFAPTMVFRGPMTGNEINLAGAAPFDGNAQFTEITKDVVSSERPLLTEVNVSYMKKDAKDSSDAGHTAEMISGWCIAISPGGNTGPTADPTHTFVGVGTSSRSITAGTGGELIADDAQSRFDPRHNGANNFLFTDGHVDPVSTTNKDRRNRIHARWNNMIPAAGK